MAISVPSQGRMMASIRLTQVPLAVRRRFGRRLLDDAIESGNVLAAVQIQAAIEDPSERIYWLPAEAVGKVMRR